MSPAQLCISLLAAAAFGSPAIAQEGRAGDVTSLAERIRTAVLADVLADETRIRLGQDVVPSFAAVNRTGNVRVRFDASGVEIEDRGSGAHRARLTLETVGRGDGAGSPLPDVTPVQAGEHGVEYRRGPCIEWYRNDERGLEQAFTLSERPAGAGPLRLAFSLETGLEPRVDSAATCLDLVEGGHARLRFSDLATFDRDGDAVACRFEIEDGGYAIVVDDASADYPLVIDPIASSPAFSVEGDFASAQFGIAIASAGDVDGDGFSDLIVGASNFDTGLAFEGKAYLYPGSATGLSTTATWSVAGGQANAYFGRTVASAGDVNDDGFSDVLVSAQLFDFDQTDEGRVFLYLGGASGLSISPATAVDGDQTDAHFGQALATAGDVNGDGMSDVALAASLYDFGGNGNAGLVAVFHGTGSGISATRSSVYGGAQFDAQLGSSVASAGDVNGDGFADLAIGAQLFNDTKVDEGKAFVYHGTAFGLAVSPTFTAVGNQTSAQFANSLSSAGDVNGDGYSDLIVGAMLYDFGEPDEGRAFIYTGSASGLAAAASWVTEANQVNARHGNVVTTAGDVDGDGYSDVAVGALLWDGTLSDQGRVRLHHGSANGPSTTAAQTMLGSATSEFFGQALAFAGDVNGDGLSDLAIGAQAFTDVEPNEGLVVVHHGAIAPLATAFQWASKGQQAAAGFGRSSAFAGDVNGDGYGDVAFGAPDHDQIYNGEGRAALHFGSASGLTAASGWSTYGGQNGAKYGSAVAGVGDLNGDGFDDLLVSATAYDHLSADLGQVRIFAGSATGPSTTASQTFVGEEVGASFGGRIAPAGDVDGDGFVDVLIGSSEYSGAFTDGGRVQLHRGTANGLESTPSFIRDALAADEALGAALDGAGDVDQDGFADVLIAAPAAGSDLGRVECFLGSSTGLPASPSLTIVGLVAGETFGVSLAGVGDVNADGFADAVIGAKNAGRVFQGSAAGISGAAVVTLTGDSSTGQFGASVARGGDVNRDGFCDVLVGAPTEFGGQIAEGRAYLFPGGASGVVNTKLWSSEGDQANAGYGQTLAGGGDVDGDGASEVLVCAPLGENGLTDEGRAFLFYGNGDGGAARGVRPRRLRSDQVAPLAHLGRSFASSFRVEELARSPFGRTLVALEIETQPSGSPFTGAATILSAFTDTGTSGAVLSESSGNLANGSHRVRSRLRLAKTRVPYQPATAWLVPTQNGVNEADVVIGPKDSLLVVSPNADLEISHVVGDAEPDDVVCEISNLGSGSLGYFADESPDAAWLTIAPISGGSLVAGGLPSTVTFSFATSALMPGDYGTTVTLTNVGDPTDQVVIPVALTVTNPAFVPGDRLLAAFNVADDVIDADFEGVTGETLKLKFDPVAAPFELTARVLDEFGDTVVSTQVALKSGLQVKKNLVLDQSGSFTLRLIAKNDAIGAFTVNTSAKFPALAKAQNVALAVKSGKTKSTKLLAVEGAVMQFRLSGDTEKPLTLGASTPDGNVLDFTDDIVVQGDGSLKVIGVLLEETGQYSLKVTNAGGGTAGLLLNLEPDQPIGRATITLP